MTSDSIKERFEYPVLTKILGALYYPVLKKLKDEVKVKAASIFSEPGVGQNGHLGLVSTATEYTQVSSVTYDWLTQPTALMIWLSTALTAFRYPSLSSFS